MFKFIMKLIETAIKAIIVGALIVFTLVVIDVCLSAKAMPTPPAEPTVTQQVDQVSKELQRAKRRATMFDYLIVQIKQSSVTGNYGMVEQFCAAARLQMITMVPDEPQLRTEADLPKECVK